MQYKYLNEANDEHCYSMETVSNHENGSNLSNFFFRFGTNLGDKASKETINQ